MHARPSDPAQTASALGAEPTPPLIDAVHQRPRRARDKGRPSCRSPQGSLASGRPIAATTDAHLRTRPIAAPAYRATDV